MSEYITVDVENTDDPDRVCLITNQNLAPDGLEQYATREASDNGSPLAQTLFGIQGLTALEIEKNTLLAQRDPAIDWAVLIDEITMALKDFFL